MNVEGGGGGGSLSFTNNKITDIARLMFFFRTIVGMNM